MAHCLISIFLNQCLLLFNSLTPGRPGCHFKSAIFNLVLLNGFSRSSNDNAPRWMPWDLTDDKSTLVQVMAWCRQATSHYLNQCWPSSMSPYGVTRPQWVNGILENTLHIQMKFQKLIMDSVTLRPVRKQLAYRATSDCKSCCLQAVAQGNQAYDVVEA